ncbi:UNVERIFIED_ORG: flagellar hook-length control protein [Escherichia phage CMSTMSU]
MNGSGTGLAVTNNATVGGTLGVVGQTTLGSVKTGATLTVGTPLGEQPETVQIMPDTYIAGKLRVEGGINADIDVGGQTLEPFAVIASDSLSSAGNITAGAAIISSSATIGEVGSQNNNLIVNGNVVNNGNFTVTGVLNAQLNQADSDVAVKSLTATNNVAAGTTLSAGTAITAGTSITATGLLKGNTLLLLLVHLVVQ